jgi:hypothetical protein
MKSSPTISMPVSVVDVQTGIFVRPGRRWPFGVAQAGFALLESQGADRRGRSHLTKQEF